MALGHQRGRWWLCAVAVVLCATASTAHAQDDWNDSQLLPVRIDVHGTLDWESRLGCGLRVDYALLGDGVVRDAKDELALTAGFDFIFEDPSTDNDPAATWFSVHIQWNLGINEKVVFYSELGLLAQWDDGWEGFYPSIGLGARYYLWRSVSLFVRLGWPVGIAAGVTF